MLLGRELRDFLPQKKGPAIKSYKDMRDKWQDMAEWREIVLAPRQERMHDRLSQGTKELPPLNTGDFVMIQN